MVSLLVLALVAVVVWLYASGKFDSTVPTAAAPPAQRVSVVNGMTLITLDAATQDRSGIRTAVLAPSKTHVETTAYATVMDLQPLLDLRTHFSAATADAEVARAVATASGQEYQRDQILYHDNQNVSLKVLQAAEASFRADQAKAEAAALATQNIRSAALQQFGETLSRWALNPHGTEFARLTEHLDVLLRVTVPLGESLAAPSRIAVDTGDGKRLSAELVTASSQSDPAVQGRAFIYRAAAPIAVGTRVAAYLPTTAATTAGVFIPGSAVVWYGGQPWAYVQISADRFGRTPVPEQFPFNNGYVATHGFVPGVRVVVSGAQLLLSEELRPQPGSAAACKDPECD
jgi:hypothetical protein